jgi:transposase
MHASNVSAPIANHSDTIFVAIELSQKRWVLTVHSPDRDGLSQPKLAGGDHAGLLRLISDIRERVRRKLGKMPAVVTCYEAGYDGFWLHRLLSAAGIANYVFDPASIAVEQRRRRAKTDRIDGQLLLRTLMAHVRGEPRVVRIVRVPSREQEDTRRMNRERDRLVSEQTAHTNRIKALLRQHGMAVGKPRRRDWLKWLCQQRDWESQAVPPGMLAELTREHARLMLICEQLEAATRELAAATAAAAHERDLLERLKSLGLVTSAGLANEVFYKDFHNRRQVAAYIGLAPSPWQSGGTDREQGISKAGNPRARRLAIELAWLWVRHQPDSALTQWFKARTLNASKRIKRIAIVALARKLMVALWRYLTTGLVPEGAALKPVKA